MFMHNITTRHISATWVSEDTSDIRSAIVHGHRRRGSSVGIADSLSPCASPTALSICSRTIYLSRYFFLPYCQMSLDKTERLARCISIFSSQNAAISPLYRFFDRKWLHTENTRLPVERSESSTGSDVIPEMRHFRSGELSLLYLETWLFPKTSI